MDIFLKRNINPMLIAEEKMPFDSKDYFFELKFDGIRCLAYLGPEGTDLRNKRGNALSPIFPELQQIHNQVDGRVILDGELVVLSQGKPDFEKLQSRAMMSIPFKVKMAAEAYPATYIAFDILYRNGQELFYDPLTERKQMLMQSVHENEQLAISRVIEENGTSLYDLAVGMELEGIVAKRTNSMYYQGKRSKDWIKIKYMQEDDFIATGFIYMPGNGVSIVLGNQADGILQYKGHVSLGVTWAKVKDLSTTRFCPFIQVPYGFENATWFEALPLCTVKYMKRTGNGGMRQPVFKGFRMGVLS